VCVCVCMCVCVCIYTHAYTHTHATGGANSGGKERGVRGGESRDAGHVTSTFDWFSFVN
jgi:hypothetical protein